MNSTLSKNSIYTAGQRFGKALAAKSAIFCLIFEKKLKKFRKMAYLSPEKLEYGSKHRSLGF